MDNFEELPERIDLGDVHAFVHDDVLMVKAVDDHGDPAELTEDAAAQLARWLLAWAKRLDVPWSGSGNE